IKTNLIVIMAVLGFQLGFSQEPVKPVEIKPDVIEKPAVDPAKEKELAEKQKAEMEKELKKTEKEKKKLDNAKRDVEKSKERLKDCKEELADEQKKFDRKMEKGKLDTDQEIKARKKLLKLAEKQQKYQRQLEKDQKALDKLMK
ncbi:MAG TPA: hypothetical protein VLB74_07125, partial [Flavobacterium sp.]|uniref:hypothetical protein n=1 Tax=Flavobacterium sp. TaxID=239 RepID=UPI002C7A163F